MRRLALLLVVLFAVGCDESSNVPVGDEAPPVSSETFATDSSETINPSEVPNATVERVIDGDTVEVRYENEVLAVRLIGVDTPETVAPGEPVACYGPAASRFTKDNLSGKDVRLEFDVERLDRYGRTLAYVWVGEVLFNEELVLRGFAQVSTFPPNVKYVDQFLAAQRDARKDDRGLWKKCEAGGQGQGDGQPDGSGGGGDCDHQSYPDVCIPPYPPDLDCGDVSFVNFTVKPPDPHGFDGDGDGVGCES
jgi:micrococcal nuclease